LPVAVVAVLGPVGYILVLFAMQVAPVGHVAPARELATLVGSYFGVKLLKERMTPARVLGAVLIVIGVISLAITRPAR
jgi:drug/metabolite transporter (DMT)-like permease